MYKIIAKFWLVLFLTLSSMTVGQASTYFSYVYEVESVSATNNTYHYTMEYWKTNYFNEPNPCKDVLGAGARGCYLTINHLHSGKTTGGISDRIDWSCAINFIDYPNMDSIIRDAQSQCGLSFPRSGKSRHSGRITTDECVGIFLGRTNKQGSATILPGGICGIAPPPAGKCYFSYVNNNQLVLDHGSLNPEQLNNNKQSGMFTVICNKDMAIQVMSNMSDSLIDLRSDGSLRSYITLNGSPASAGLTYNMKANVAAPIMAESTLITRGDVTPGKFSGRITLVMVVP